MKANHVTLRTILIGLSLVALSLPASAQTWTRYKGKSIGSKVTIDGTSTLHDWTVEGKMVGGIMELDEKFPLDPAAKPAADAKLNAKVEVTIPVTSLLSGKKLMDEVMYEHMKQRQYKTIDYKLKQISLKSGAQAGALQFDTVGDLSVAGMMKPVSMVVTMERVDQNQVKVKGEIKVKMTTWGIKPPSPNIGLGLIKTGDDVTLKFEWLTAKVVDAPKAAESK